MGFLCSPQATSIHGKLLLQGRRHKEQDHGQQVKQKHYLAPQGSDRRRY
jgi:hypothetical protein